VGTQVERIVRECGFVVEPGDVTAFVEAIVALLGNPEKRKELGARGREIACEKWEKNNVLSSVFSDYISVTGK
jgi:colanic acid biosynthesis glycosyl transferase WcaI